MERQPRILVTGDNGESLPPPYGGIMKRCLLHAKQWRDKGAQVYIHIHHHHDKENDLGAEATYFYDYARKPQFSDKIAFALKNFVANPGLYLALLALEIRLGPPGLDSAYLYCAARGVALDRKVREVRPDVIVTETGGFPTLVAVAVAKRHKIPIMLENYAELQLRLEVPGAAPIDSYHRLWTYIVNNCSAIVSASRHCSKGPLRYVNDAARVKIIYSGINFDVFNSRIDRDKGVARAKFGLPQDRFIIMAVGSLKMRKGHDQLFEALTHLDAADRAKVFVVLCGMGDKEELAARAADMGFGENGLKIFSGLTEDDLAELYSSADAFCFPSITPRECMGMAMKEAMAIGLPVAAYDSGGISEAIQDGVNGYLAPTGNREALAAVITKIMHLDPATRLRMGAANVEKAKTLFDIKATADEIYQDILRLRHDAKPA